MKHRNKKENKRKENKRRFKMVSNKNEKQEKGDNGKSHTNPPRVICLPGLIGSSKSTEWKTEIKFVTKCDFHDEESGVIFMPIDVHTKIMAMTDAMGSTEWLGYLVGVEKGGAYTIFDLNVPEQEVTGASVDVIGTTPEKVIGTIHSHHNMGAFFSGTDDEFIGSNHDVMIVVGSDEYKARIRRKLPCGAFINAEAQIRIYSPDIDTKKFVDDNMPKIQKKVFVQKFWGGWGSNAAAGGGYNNHVGGFENNGGIVRESDNGIDGLDRTSYGFPLGYEGCPW